MAGKILGLEIGLHGVAGVVLEKKGKSMAVIQAAYALCQEGARDTSHPDEPDHDKIKSDETKSNASPSRALAFGDALGRVLSNMDTTGCTAWGVAFHAGMLSFRTLSFPFGSPSKIRSTVDYEISSYLPLIEGDYITDFRILRGPLAGEEDGGFFYRDASAGTSVLTASVPGHVVETCLEILDEKGIRPDFITVTGVPPTSRKSLWGLNSQKNAGGIRKNIRLQGADRQDAHKQGAHRQDAHRQDAHKQSAHRQDAHKQDAHKQDAHKQDAHKQGAHRQGADVNSLILLEGGLNGITATFIYNRTLLALRTFQPSPPSDSFQAPPSSGSFQAPPSLGSFLSLSPDFIDTMIHQTIIALNIRHDIEMNPVGAYLISWEPALSPGVPWNLPLSKITVQGLTLREMISPDEILLPDYMQPFTKHNSYGSGEIYLNAVMAGHLSNTGHPPFNFCRGPYAGESFFLKYGKNILLLSFFMLLCFTAAVFNIKHETGLLKKELKDLDSEMVAIFTRAFPEETTIVDPLMQMKVKIRDAQRGDQTMPGHDSLSSAYVIDVLKEISSRIPDEIDVEINRFLFGEGRVVMSGTTDNFNAVNQIQTRLEQWDGFALVTISSATAEKNGNRVKFDFTIRLH
ncbi:MAG: PilN domain-containing protein [Desulfamplus sp.]|nr:PilN domain-containing protein [Desulfamplus sp.]